MPEESVQMQMVRRYARLLREQQAQYRGPRIGARERRTDPGTARDTAETAAQRALGMVQPPRSSAT